MAGTINETSRDRKGSELETLGTALLGEHEGNTKNSLGTINGCYIPCLLNILGAVLFLRVGFSIGMMGCVPALHMSTRMALHVHMPAHMFMRMYLHMFTFFTYRCTPTRCPHPCRYTCVCARRPHNVQTDVYAHFHARVQILGVHGDLCFL